MFVPFTGSSAALNRLADRDRAWKQEQLAVICSEACWEGSAEEPSAVSRCLFLLLFCFLGQGGFITKSRGPGDSPDRLTCFLSFGCFRSAAQCRSLSSGSVGSLQSAPARVSAAYLFYSGRRVVRLSGAPKDRSISDRLFVIAVMFWFILG